MIKLTEELIKELDAETAATRKCLERIPVDLFGWKPHEKSMELGYLAILVADMPRWITYMIELSVIDLAAYKPFQPKSSAELANYFDENVKGAKKSLQNTAEEELSQNFYLKNKDQVLYTSPKGDSIGSTINHMVHHRGQLTVYMRLNNIPVPSIYGPSADDRSF
ncbi:MAG: DinB family protein [Ignavibacteriaceae bacterium]